MILYVHIGTEKTGSSYLQSMLAINRGVLRKKEIWFPKAGKREKDLIHGEISAGNAKDITDSLNADDYFTCKKIIRKHEINARKLNCSAVFLSNELLVLAFAKKNTLSKFNKIVKQIGFSEVKYLLLLRNPVDHALSLFKHRAKRGTATEIEYWPEEHYHYGNGLFSFFNEAMSEDIDLNCRKFFKMEGYLEKVLFKEWLGIDETLEHPSKPVNPSLSLSELLLIKKLRSHDIYLSELLYKKLLLVPKKDKAEEYILDLYYRDILSDFLKRFKKTWKVCNQELPSDEQIDLPETHMRPYKSDYKKGSFSDRQLEEISKLLADSQKVSFKVKVHGLKWRSKLGKFKRKIIN